VPDGAGGEANSDAGGEVGPSVPGGAGGEAGPDVADGAGGKADPGVAGRNARQLPEARVTGRLR
jgi:hypothetical protein